MPKQTRGWDDAGGVTRGQRHKEESSDYRYFPDPDLVPVTVTADKVAAVRESLGELPAELRQRLEADLWHHALRQRRAREPGAAAGGLLRGGCRADRRRQAGRQLGHARRASRR